MASFSIEHLIRPKSADSGEKAVASPPASENGLVGQGAEDGPEQVGPIRQNLSFLDVILPHIQMICNSSNLGDGGGVSSSSDMDATSLKSSSNRSASNNGGKHKTKNQPSYDWTKFLQNSMSGVTNTAVNGAPVLASGFFFQQMHKTKRIRTAFSPAQLMQLEKAFKVNHYVIGTERKLLAKKLALSETQNRRTKQKRSDPGPVTGSPSPPPAHSHKHAYHREETSFTHGDIGIRE